MIHAQRWMFLNENPYTKTKNAYLQHEEAAKSESELHIVFFFW
jgi:hypothetical protein